MKIKAAPSSLFVVGLAGLVSVGYLIFVVFFPAAAPGLRRNMVEASRLMAESEAAIKECREAAGVPIDPKTDPNRTGLIGIEMSPITTTLGNIEAKRTTTNPNFGGLAALLLNEAGVRSGDTVAIGASGSFPALIIAVLAAAKAMDLRPLLIVSLGASEWGANNPAFTWLDMADCLKSKSILDVKPIALAVGGGEDVGRDMSPDGRRELEEKIRRTGIAFIEEPDLEANVRARLSAYEAAAAGRPLRLFVNVGGGTANIGTNAGILKLRPGLVRDVPVPPAGERGVLQAMAMQGIPVVHLLNIPGLAEAYGLPWDPKPLPRPGEGLLYGRATRGGRLFISITIGYAALVFSLLIAAARRRRFPGLPPTD